MDQTTLKNVTSKPPTFVVERYIDTELYSATATSLVSSTLLKEREEFKVWVIRPGELFIAAPGLDPAYARIRGKRITMPEKNGRLHESISVPLLDKYNDYIFEKNFL